MSKKNKATAVLEMLSMGMSTKEITNKIAVSASYVHSIKKQLAEGVGEAVGTVRQTAAEHNKKVKEMIEGWRAEAEAEAVLGMPCTRECLSEPEVGDVDAILDERATNYGSFLTMSKVTQRLKAVAHQFAGQNNKTFDADQAEALDMIFTKIGRILNGDPNHIDSWVDIAGYAKLVADRLQGTVR
jgi:transposase-like protein